MREGAVNVLVARGAARAHILPEYGLSWTGADGLAALEPTRDLLHGNEPSAGGGAGMLRLLRALVVNGWVSAQ